MKHALDAGVPVNADIWPRKSLEGGLLRIPVGPEGSLCGVRLLTFLDGALFKSVPQTPALWEDLARVLARLDEALLSCRVEGLEGKSSWNMRHLEQTWAELLPSLTADVVSPEQSTLLKRGMAVFEAFKKDVEPRLRMSVIHSDANEANLLVDPVSCTRITGILDWGDCSENYLVADCSTAALYLVLLLMDVTGQGREDRPALLEALRASLGRDDAREELLRPESPLHFLAPLVVFARAYHARLPLEAAEQLALRPLLAGRLVQSLSQGALAAAERPDNAAYVLTTARSGWALLELLLELSDAEFLQICGLPGSENA
ncbi:hypothetical protein H632_c7p0 [Helicosporidium sp. ATCC 50920]|nr:hypothetical protein H632_c7p0 [Helicosporidium sp. ATCC 50920]|eukprot:KDD77152.1 hypothetical protein H632_c7p0 [Helicosporidium sp. ATCC 50920]